ncbi:uncharacterized protein DUF3348 [Paraburkholderia caballeronis]|uniref:DUF3348 domain-containing protein n=1 Tax=Paraburkholderia caballeronis TaxID=416943 RepID=UPI001066BDC0|nr:DUF3348 domain-containing protein [Paraburkholderia caballeronis]TDV38258.1 uncharacterized protein DUF3348 [Paraburkholderia caballeronis]
MVQALQRTAVRGPTLVRLLARIADVDVSESRQSLSDRLSEWLGWPDAITLSTALAGAPPAAARFAQAAGGDASSLCAHARRSLTAAITAATRAPSMRGASAAQAAAAADTTADYADFRQRYLAVQQAMETDLGDLRARLRVMVAAMGPEMARLATVDAAMERALGARERGLFATVPALLGAHFERLRDAQQPTPAADADTTETRAAAPGAWLRAFRTDMQSVLLAELDVRFQPVEGLLAALRTR